VHLLVAKAKERTNGRQGSRRTVAGIADAGTRGAELMSGCALDVGLPDSAIGSAPGLDEVLTPTTWVAVSNLGHITRQRVGCERSVGGRIQSESMVGSMVWSATVTSSAESVPRSTSSRRRVLNASMVWAAW
jgi:hypothetical protein